MADLVMGAMPSIIPKLYKLLEKEYKLQSGVKDSISTLTKELESAEAMLRKVAQVPWDQLDEQVQIWARQVREGSYDMEDILDSFLVRVQGSDSGEQEGSLKRLSEKMTNLWPKIMARRRISCDVKDIMTHLQDVAERCRRYKVDNVEARPATASIMDPRLAAMYTQVKNLVGMDKSSSELISMVHNPEQGDISSMKMKVVSIVGVGGLGKTTLAKAVYEKIKGNFGCPAFVPVGRNPDLKKIFKDILIDLDKQRYLQYSTAALDERQLIDELRGFFLKKKERYLIVIDDIWEVESWERIKLAMDDDNNPGGRIIITTRILDVAKKADTIYNLQPLPDDMSRELFIRRISGHDGKYAHSQPDEILDEFIRKCSGIPLAIITMASLLAGKKREEWSKLYNNFGFGSKFNKESENTKRILSFSYYDLPSHLRTCLLYLSAFPEDSFIDKSSLIWMWVAEGFVHKKNGIGLYEIGEGYFNDLINRSLIQAEEHNDEGNIMIGCRVHDIVLDFICVMSQEEFFFTVLDNDHDTLLQQRNTVRRIANHNRTIGHPHQTNHIETPKLRSFIALRCVTEKPVSLSSFTILRVLAIENCNPEDRRRVQVEGLRYLLQLRFLSLRGTRIDRIPEEIRAPRFLQTLDLLECNISELPPSGSLPKRLAFLRISLNEHTFYDCKVFSVEGMTSLEELTIQVHYVCRGWWRVKGLGSLSELRVLSIIYLFWDEDDQRDSLKSLGHLDKLQRLTISSCSQDSFMPQRLTDLVLPHHVEHLAVRHICSSKLPPSIHPSCVPNLSHLDLMLHYLDEEDLKTLGRLPELHYLRLDMWWYSRPATIHNISDSDSCYFPKLTSFKLKNSMFSFVVNKDDKRVSFHMWSGCENYSISDHEMHSPTPSHTPSVSDDELERGRPSVSDDELRREHEMWSRMPFVSDDDFISDHEMQSPTPAVSNGELEIGRPSLSDDELNSDHEMQSHMPSISDDELERARPSVSDDELKSGGDDDELHRPPQSSKLQQRLAAVAYYLLAFFLRVLAYVKRWPLKLMGQHPLPYHPTSSPRNGNGNGEDTTAMPSVSDDENKGSTIRSKGAAAAPLRFMPSLQVLHFEVDHMPEIPDLVYNLGWEQLSSLREINAHLNCFNSILKTELRRAAKVHPNHPALNV